ncbi:hypothetical protein B2G71_06940 [Novosphingobium sp. PC22D]|uniref:NRDE family protein n=1 Tax=Novosphingobium sp. PC22D TaxID=1962403 RepID=UPI000BEF9ADE|nr:NRDE family protein [Novosphingobium sp. PC22D]PEQ13178.1 hypothetical protein B2G71_06940 [Novosphingobium sp. PC22D]
MCVAAIAWLAHPRWRVAIIANRDEFHARPTAPLARWDDGSGVIAGRDLRAGGTWLGVTTRGRFGLVTNFRRPGYPKPEMASRGALVSDWLRARPDGDHAAMNPFHLLRGDAGRCEHLTNWPSAKATPLAPGIHGVSNGAFDTPWPKTARLASALSEWLAQGGDALDPLFAALADETPLPPEPDSEGPEQRFSPVFIRDPDYGTRCSSVVLLGADGNGCIVERSFDPKGAVSGEIRIDLEGVRDR